MLKKGKNKPAAPSTSDKTELAHVNAKYIFEEVDNES
jgi:hypothetical protein